MKNIDYLIGKIKRMICFVFGHRYKLHLKIEERNDDINLKVKYCKCARCGKRILFDEFEKNYYKAINI